ncbi:MAG: hypothetical protein IKL18_09745, partial [Oscillospiraceae bacterium]|nr:hypothetical protein [Oscillospiraceae bacterium]
GYNPSVSFADSLVTLLSSSPTFPLIGESSLHKGAYPLGRLFRNVGDDVPYGGIALYKTGG